jgi:hypothetical protein
MKMNLLMNILLLNSLLAFPQEYINDALFGFGTNTTFIFHDVNDSFFVNKVLEIAPKILRFPGGLGNFYHIDKTGYGLQLEEVEKYHYGKMPKRVKGLNRIIKNKGDKANYIDYCIILANKINAKVIIDANILTADSTETIRIISKFLNHNIEVVGVELGSELSNMSYMHLIDGAEYLQLAQEQAAIIKRVYPKIKIGVVAAPNNRNQKRHQQWNHILAKETFFDAIIVHTYAKVTKGKDQYGKMISEVTEGQGKQEAFDLYKKRVLYFFSDSYNKEIANYNQVFPNKEIWITEWNLQMSKITANTLFQGLFAANYLLEIATNPQLKSINLASFHNLAGRDLSGSILMKKGKEIEIHSTYYPMHMLAPIFNQNRFYGEQSIITQECFEYKFYNEDYSRQINCWVNWTDSPISYSLDLLGEGPLTIKSFFGEALFSLNTEKETIHYEILKINNPSEMMLKPYSLTIVYNLEISKND